MGNIKKNIAYNTFYQILCLITPMITIPYVSRILGPDGVGIYSYTHSLVTYFVMFAALGTATYGAREISRNRENKKNVSKLFWEIELLTIFTSVICVLAWLLFSVIYSEYRPFMLILTLNIFATMFDISWLYTGLEKFKYTVSVNSIFKILGVIFSFKILIICCNKFFIIVILSLYFHSEPNFAILYANTE